MTESQILEELISFYESKGIDLHRILVDPMFTSMPIQAKLNAIKLYAGRMAAGTGSGYSSRDKKNIGWGSLAGALTGALTGYKISNSAISKFVDGEAGGIMVPAVTATAGALIGAALAGNKYLNRVSERRSMKNSLEQAAREGTDSSALRTLALNNLIGSKYDQSDLSSLIGEAKPMDLAMSGFKEMFPPVLEEHNIYLGHVLKDKYKQEKM